MEMKEERCHDRRSWEEDLYWTRFQSLQFFQLLHTGFDRQLAIPENFTRNLKRKLPDTITLKTPSGSEWEVALTTKENTLFFDHGWGEFVKDNSLKENDILVFKYNGESCLDVSLFNGQSMCETVSSYFFRKRCGHETQFHLKSTSAESLSFKKDAQNLNSRSVTEFTTPVNTPNYAQNKELSSACSEEIETKPDIGQAYSQSGRKPITEADKWRVLQLGQAILSPEGFLRIMKPTHVRKKYVLNIPLEWMIKNLTFRKNHDIILRINENTWKARVFCSSSPQNRGVLGGGWRNFVLDNNLNEFDVCVFEPRGQLNHSLVLDVYIFHTG